MNRLLTFVRYTVYLPIMVTVLLTVAVASRTFDICKECKKKLTEGRA